MRQVERLVVPPPSVVAGTGDIPHRAWGALETVLMEPEEGRFAVKKLSTHFSRTARAMPLPDNVVRERSQTGIVTPG